MNWLQRESKDFGHKVLLLSKVDMVLIWVGAHILVAYLIIEYGSKL